MGIDTYPLKFDNLARIKTGTYTGDGTVSQGITGVGFRVRFLMIFFHPVAHNTDSYIFFKMDQTWGDYAIRIYAGLSKSYASMINSLDVDGFTVDDAGADQSPNTNGQVYDYVAFG